MKSMRDAIGLGLGSRPNSRDRDPASQSFYGWYPVFEIPGFTRPGIKVGARRDNDIERPFTVYRDPVGIAASWPGRLLRVGDVVGLRRKSYEANGRTDAALCEGYTVLEELRPTIALGPGGELAAQIAEQAVAMTASDVERLGQIAMASGVGSWTRYEQARLHEALGLAAATPGRLARLNPLPEHVLPQFLRLARRTDPKRLVGEFETNDWPVEDIADYRWSIARIAVKDALAAAVWVDLIAPETHTVLLKPWRAFRSEVERRTSGD